MKKSTKLFSKGALALATATLLSTATMYGVPARPGAFKYDNNGKELTVTLHGDEHSHYYLSSDGHMLLRGDDGIFRYALPDGNRLRASQLTASDPMLRSIEETDLLNSFAKEAPFNILKKNARKSGSRVAGESYLNTFPTKGSPRCLAILVEYQDVKFTLPNPKQTFTDMLNKEGFDDYHATGSARDFFIASSNGQFSPQFDVYGPVTLPYNMSYYGSNNEGGDDARPYEMLVHAADLLSDEIDFSIYDTDNDGIVDNVYIFYAGYGEADGGPANSVWPHSWNIHDDLNMEIYMNGKLLNHYATSNELSDGIGSQLAGIGVFCHEFSHVMGLPDLYSTTYTGAFTPDAWSLMDHGSYNNNSHTPPYHTGYERYCLGWIEPKLLSKPANVTMYPVSTPGCYNDVYILPTEKNSEYYIFENRQQKGWDEFIPGHGMLVWHIDFVPDIWNLNILNIDKQYVDIVEADGTQTEWTRSGDTFPGTDGITEFTDDTNPSMRSWSGTALHSPLTDIKEISGVISFAFKGGENMFDEMVALPAESVATAAFTARWNELPKTTGYILSVYRKENGTPVYLDGYRKLETGNVTSYRVEGLDPQTTYYYVVAGTNGRFYSDDSNEVEVTTLEPTLDYLSVTATGATDVSDTSFRANWLPLELADRYEVNVYSLQLGEAFLNTADFSNRALPTGWDTNASYDGRASYAVETPSLRMTADGNYLTTAPLTGIRSLSFWYRASQPDANASLIVEAFNNNSWDKIAEITPLATDKEGARVELTEIPATSTRIRIIFRRGESGSVSIDDVTVGYGGNLEFIPMPGRQNIDAGAECSLLIDGLAPESNYGYSVTAFNSEVKSNASQIVGVLTLTSGLEEIIPESGEFTLTDVSGLTVARGTLPGFNFNALPAGIYLLKRGNTVKKIIIK